MTKPLTFASLMLAALMSVPAIAQDSESSAESQSAPSADAKNTQRSSIQLETTSVTGSRELPKVLVIVPWKSSEALGPGERPLASLVEEALTPVDPDVFRRQLDYYTKLNEAAATKGNSQNAK